MSFEMVEFDEKMRDHSWEWLQDDELRALTAASELTREQQLEWFRRIPERTDYLIKGVVAGGEPVAVFGLKNIEGSSAEYFAFIGPESRRGTGIGRFMHDNMVALAIGRGINRIWGAANNPRTYGAHLHFGWYDTGEKDDRGITIIAYDIEDTPGTS